MTPSNELRSPRPKPRRRIAAAAFAALLAVGLFAEAVCPWHAAICPRPETICPCASRASAAAPNAAASSTQASSGAVSSTAASSGPTPGAAAPSAVADAAALGAVEAQLSSQCDVDDGDVKAVFKLPTGDVELAAVIDCEILVLAPSGAEYRIELPRSEWLSGGIQIIENGPTRVARGDGTLISDRWTLQLMPMETGELSILGPAIVCESPVPNRPAGTGAVDRGAAGGDTPDEGSGTLSQKVVLQLPSRILKVVNPLDELGEAELRPMKDPIPARPDYRRPAAILAALIGGIASVALLARVIRHRLRRRDRREHDVPRRPAHEIAYERLRKIEEDELIERCLHREFHFAISACLREYLENRYGVPALEMTTEEFLVYSGTRSDLPDICRSSVVDLLNLSDLVKFAKRESMSGEMRHVLESVRRLVDDTREAGDTREVGDVRQADHTPEAGDVGATDDTRAADDMRAGDDTRAADNRSDGSERREGKVIAP